MHTKFSIKFYLDGFMFYSSSDTCPQRSLIIRFANDFKLQAKKELDQTFFSELYLSSAFTCYPALIGFPQKPLCYQKSKRPKTLNPRKYID